VSQPAANPVLIHAPSDRAGTELVPGRPRVHPNGSPALGGGNGTLIHRDTTRVRKPIVALVAGLIVVAGVVLALVLAGVGQDEGGAAKPVTGPTLTTLWASTLEAVDESRCDDLSVCGTNAVSKIQSTAEQITIDAQKRNATAVIAQAQDVQRAATDWLASCSETYAMSPNYNECDNAMGFVQEGPRLMLDEIRKFDAGT
jgi:hypothetical protein